MLEQTTNESYGERITLGDISRLLEKSRAVYQDKGLRNLAFRDARRIAHEIIRSGNICFVFGLGFPFYLGERANPPDLLEIETLINEKLEAIADAVGESGAEGAIWPCPNCGKTVGVNLRTRCDSCGETSIKPIGIFKTFPDIDIAAVVASRQKIETATGPIANALLFKGWRPADIDISMTLGDMADLLEGNEKKGIPRPKLPVDLHLIKEEEFRQVIEATGEGNLDRKAKCLAWRGEWVPDHLRLPLTIFFSLQELYAPKDSPFRELLAESRRKALAHFGSVGSLTEEIAQRYFRISGLLKASPTIRHVFERRLRVALTTNNESAKS